VTDESMTTGRSGTDVQAAPAAPVAASEAEARAIAEEARETQWRKPSFAKELYLGRFRLDLVHPHPRSAAEDVQLGEAFLDRLRAFCEAECDGGLIEREARIPDEVVKGLVELGAFGIKIPREYGGLGLSHVYYNRALQIITMVHASLAALVSAHQSIGVPEPLKLAGTPEQKQRYLPRGARSVRSCSPRRTSVPTPHGWG
jgi:alkylation response protein AidB-like acyl-CoA dehydrogenase